MTIFSDLRKSAFAYILISLLACGKGSGDGGGTTPPEPTPGTNTFTNPLLPSGPDPWVIRQGDAYYYTHTQGNKISIWKTSKMSGLREAPVQTVWSPPATGPNSKNIWAPELHFLNNKWYLYYTAGATDD